MAKITVLIVDDSSEVQDALQGILRSCPDIEIVGEAANGLEAIEKSGKFKPSVVLMDGAMPEMDGVEATRRIKERLPDVKILFLTVLITDAYAAFEAGADGFVVKDSGKHEILDAVRALGHQHRGVASRACQTPVAKSALCRG